MLPYWFLFLFMAAGVGLSRPNPDPRKAMGLLWVAVLLVAVLVGLRFEVGADWKTYIYIYRTVGYRTFGELVFKPESGFQLLNYFSLALGAGIWLVNLFSALIFAIGLVLFVRRQVDPWLALVAAVPYLITVVAMGYTRQSIAIGFILIGLAHFFQRPSAMVFAGWIVLAALFHRTAVIAFPLVAFAVPRNRLINVTIVLASAYFLWDLFLADTMQSYVRNYVDVGYSSQGAAVRLALSAVAATILLLTGKKLQFPPVEQAVWRNFSIVSLLLLVALALSPSSTAVDRIALYMIPLQLAVFARAPILIRDWKIARFAIILVEALVLFVWLNFAAHAQYWVPYRFYPL